MSGKRTIEFTDRAVRGLPIPPKPQQLDYFDTKVSGLANAALQVVHDATLSVEPVEVRKRAWHRLALLPHYVDLHNPGRCRDRWGPARATIE